MCCINGRPKIRVIAVRQWQDEGAVIRAVVWHPSTTQIAKPNHEFHAAIEDFIAFVCKAQIMNLAEPERPDQQIDQRAFVVERMLDVAAVFIYLLAKLSDD